MFVLDCFGCDMSSVLGQVAAVADFLVELVVELDVIEKEIMA